MPSHGCFKLLCNIHKFSTAIHWKGFAFLNVQHMVHTLDDFLILGSHNACHRDLTDFLQFYSVIGIPITMEQTVYPSKIITFMGLELDSISMEARLPEDKLEKLQAL